MMFLPVTMHKSKRMVPGALSFGLVALKRNKIPSFKRNQMKKPPMSFLPPSTTLRPSHTIATIGPEVK